MANAFVVNCRPSNWEICKKETIFGLKTGIRLPSLQKGDIILFRVSGSNYGVKAIWYFEQAVRVDKYTVVPWNDSLYEWILKCKPIVELSKVFTEDFQTTSKKSTKISEFYAGGIVKSIVSLKPLQAHDYITNILKEFYGELDKKFVYMGHEKLIKEFLEEFLSSLDLKEAIIKPTSIDTVVETPDEDGADEKHHVIDVSKKPSPLYGIVGERIDLPILNYAPLNEKGVILLFGYYLQDLGISHVEEIKSGFPDAIAMQSIGNGKYKRIKIEFEYKSSSFLAHKHNIDDCDMIICWIHDWQDCPLQVIELSTVLFQQDTSN